MLTFLTKHTSGPWRDGGGIEQPRGKGIAPLLFHTVLTEQGVTIANVVSSKREEREANTRLIAAAPDLLAALNQLNDATERQLEHATIDHMNALTAALRSARKAIAKAESGV